MRLVSAFSIFISSTSFATSVSVEIVPVTPREVNQIFDVIFRDDDDDAVEDPIEIAAPMPMGIAVVREMSTHEGAHIEWDTGNEGERFVRFRATPALPQEIVPNTLGEILEGGYVPGSPFFYFIVKSDNGHRSLYLFGFRERFIFVMDLGEVDFEVIKTGLFQGNPEQLYLIIGRDDNLRAFHWTHEQTVPLICPDLEEGMTIRRAGRVVDGNAAQTFWIIDIAQHPHLYIDNDEVNMDDWEPVKGGMRLRVQSPPQAPKPATKKTFRFSWRRDK